MFESIKPEHFFYGTRIQWEGENYGFTHIIFWSGSLLTTGQPDAQYVPYMHTDSLDDIMWKEKIGPWRHLQK